MRPAPRPRPPPARADKVRAALRGACAAVWVLMGVARTAGADGGPARPTAGGPPAALPAATAAPHGARCADCHVEQGWDRVIFDHERTGFQLEGAHAKTACRGCHQRDFKTAIAETCSGCHRDRHRGELGLHCEGCHQQQDWRTPLFATAGHRGTAFPLSGKHATIPCQECHGDVRDRAFSRAPLTCVACHRADFETARVRSVDHVAAQFGTDCQSCHSTWTFFPARFAAHEPCFALGAGSHRTVRCAQCHGAGVPQPLVAACNTPNLTCTSCHSHDCARSDRQHQNVMGYSCQNQKCYECHQPRL